MITDAIQDQIDAASEERRKMRASGDTEGVKRKTAELDELFDRLRVERAEAVNGSRETIVQRARIEREIEKLMSS